MIKLVKSIKNISKNEYFWVLLTSFIFILIVFRKYFFQGLLPIPGDILTGLYYPWFDYKWGYETPVPVKNNLPSDVISILYPWRILGIRMMKAGILPLWDSTILLGTPLLANFQSALLFPLNILFFVFNEITAWSLQVVLQPALMIIAMYLFLRDLKLQKLPSIFGGILYAFSGYSIVWMEYDSINWTLGIFPILMLLTRKIYYSYRVKWIFLIAVGICISILSGYPLNVIYSLGVIFFYYTYLSAVDRKLKLRNFIQFLLGIVSGLMFSAVQLFPSIELYKNSIFAFDNVAIAGGIKYLPLTHFITFIFPDFFGNPATGNYWSVGSYDNFAFSISSVGVYFLIYFLVKKKISNRNSLIFLLLAAFSLIYATENPIIRAVSDIPLIGFKSSVSARVMFIFIFSAAVLSSLGLEEYLRKGERRKYKFIPLFIYSSPLIIVFYFFYQLNSQVDLNWLDSLLKRGSQTNEIVENYVVAVRNMVVPILTIIAVTFLTFIRNRKLFSIGLVFVLLFSITKSTDKYLSFIDSKLMYPNVEVTQYLKDYVKNSRFEKERGSATGQNASTLLSTSRYLSLINFGKIQDYSSTRFNEIKNANSPLVNTLNVSHYLFMKWDEKDSPSPGGVPKDWLVPDNFNHIKDFGSVSIYENPDNLGFAWFPKSVVCENDLEKIEAVLTDDYYKPLDTILLNCISGEEVSQITGEVEVIDKRMGL